MKILIWTGHHDPLDAAIKFLTHGPATHAAFLRRDGRTVHEAFYPQVRDRALTKEDLSNAKCFRLIGCTPEHDQMFEHRFDENIKRGIKYSIADLFRFAFNIPNKKEGHTFCSRYVLWNIYNVDRGLMPLTRLPNIDWGSPRDLLISTRLEPVPFPSSHLN